MSTIQEAIADIRNEYNKTDIYKLIDKINELETIIDKLSERIDYLESQVSQQKE